MIIDTTEVQDIHFFSKLEFFKEVYGILWILAPIFILVLGITISVLAIVWLEREIFAGIQQRIGSQCSSTRRYVAEVTHAILPGKARTQRSLTNTNLILKILKKY